MAIFKCKMCGGALEIQDGSSVAVCSFCGTKQTIPKLDNETRINLYDRANHFRRNNDYDKAMSIYEQLLDADKTDAEAYWSILLCKYGVEYVEDPQTHRMMPTINRAQYTSIFADEDYKSAIQYADGYQREVYENEAKELDKIQKGILAISQKEDPFDIFICYKETDSYGRRTQDSVLAQDLYYQLTQEGYKVFFSRITLENKLGTAYEPYIFAALNTAKIMVVIGTSKENLNSVWVKNEWSRFLALTKKDGSKVLIPAYRDMDPYDLPEEFSHLQAQDMSKLGFMQDLIRGIKKILAKDEKVVVIPQNNTTNSNGNVNALLKRAYIACEDGDFAKADSFAEKVLNINPELADAYIVKLLAECKVRRIDDLRIYNSIIKSKTNFQRAYKYAQGELKAQLSAIGKENVEYIEYYPLYCKAQNYIKQNDYSQAIGYLSKIQSYKNSAELLAQCKENLAVQKKENTYNAAINAGFSKTADDVTMLKSIEALKSLEGYKDSVENIDKLYARIDKWKYQKEIEAEKARELAAKRKHNRKIGAIVTSCCAVVLTAVLLMTFLWFIPLSNYNKAEELVKAGNYNDALSIYKELNGFSNSEKHIEAINSVSEANDYFSRGKLTDGINAVFSQEGTIYVKYDCGDGQISKTNKSSIITSNLSKGNNLKTPYRAGYSFTQWAIRDYSVSYDLETVSAELTLVAGWSECTYSVSYDLNGGRLSNYDSNPTSYKYASDDLVIKNPTKDGYVFIGWSGTEIDGLEKELKIAKGSEGDRHYVANWAAENINVTFNLNGGSMDRTQMQVAYDDVATLPIPQKSGYTFGGWYYEGKKVENGIWKITKDCTLDARWNLIPYNITYDLNGGTNAQENPSTYSAFDEVTLQEPTKVGYTFVGWNSDSLSSTTKAVSIPKGSIGDRKYVAVWQANTYTITYDANGGEINTTTQTVNFDMAFSLLTTTRAGYTFGGWYYGYKVMSSGVWNIAQNVLLTAKWTANTNTKYLVYHYLENADDNGYTLTKTDTLYGTTDSTVSPSVGTYSYFTSPSKQTLTINGNGNSTVSYYYSRNKYTLTLYPNNGKVITTKIFKYQQNISSKNTWFTKSNHTFGGWFTDVDLTSSYNDVKMGGSSLTLYAYWSGETKPSMLSYTQTSTATTINGYNGSSSTVFLPSHIKNIPLTTISNLSSTTIQTVNLPNTVVTIGNSAFANSTSLQTINLENVKFIGYYAFNSCIALDNIRLENIVTLEYYAFTNCSSISVIVLPETLVGEIDHCFQNCSGLESIVIPSSISKIEEGSFYGCTSLKKMTLPFVGIESKIHAGDDVELVNWRADYDMLGSIFGKTKWDGSTSINTEYEHAIVQYGHWVTKRFPYEFFIPQNLTEITVLGEIKPYAFSGCTPLKAITICNSVAIGEKAFENCSNLENVYAEQSFFTHIYEKAFFACRKLSNIYLPLTLKAIADGAFRGCDSLIEIKLNKSLSSIGQHVFGPVYTNESLPSLTILYEGSEEEWSNISKAPFNTSEDAWDNGRTIDVHYNCDLSYR